ncbi:acetoacetate decarboxylase family protein [Streptomyces albidochromogenes]|uniref:Acetoacetate decarboxylase family protein n=1 Tax=Streptomyces albidochromogenes TaxID=329524 RepID=A0ABW6FZR4_9ACTN
MTVDFPPEPWLLRGDMYASLWWLPVRSVPRWPLPPEVRPLVVAGRCVLVTFWVDYRPGGTLAYRELLVALVVRHRRSVAGTAVAVWVDDERSLAGGRALWGIPKELGSLTVAPARSAGQEAGQVRLGLSTGGPGRDTAVRGAYRDLVRLPGRIRVRGRLVQRHDTGEPRHVPLRVTGSPALGRMRLAAAGAGPLAFISGRRPFLTVSLRDFRFAVGRTGEADGEADT